METQENKPNTSYTPPDGARSGHILGGALIVAAGVVLLAWKAGAGIPDWLVSWPMVLILIGVYIGARHRFREWVWLVPTSIGALFLAERLVDDLHVGQFIWPLAIIAAGLVMIFKPRRNREEFWRRRFERRENFFNQFKGVETNGDRIDIVTILGGAKKMVITKNFQGGEAFTFLGGIELNLTQADVQGQAELELVQIFGGAKLVVPANWTVKTDELVCVFGGLDDKRNPNTLNPDPSKVLVLKGTCMFGGIDIKSF